MTEGKPPGRLRTKVCYVEMTTYVPISSPSYNPEQRIHATALYTEGVDDIRSNGKWELGAIGEDLSRN
jgi:hypothetical protein